MNIRVLLRKAIYGAPRLKKSLAAWLKRPSLEARLGVCEQGYFALRRDFEALKRQANASCPRAAAEANAARI